MGTIIGSARMGENGHITGGLPGDQTGNEVSTQAFYIHNKGWYVLRPKINAAAIAAAMATACANRNIGYNQSDRYGVVKYGVNATKPINSDCSSLVRACIKEATGRDVGDFSTDNEASVLEGSGLFEKRKKYVSGMALYAGDVLVTCSKGHTAIVISSDFKRSQASITDIKECFKMDVLTSGSTGNDVTVYEIIMHKLGYYNGDIDTYYGRGCADALTKFQTKYPECGTNNHPDGYCGGATWRKLFSLMK